MRAGIAVIAFLAAVSIGAQEVVYVCPMDPDVRSSKPASCPRCGMKLRAGIPDPVEFPMDLALTPRLVKPAQKTQLTFTVRDPWKGRPVVHFQEMHEKLFHLFVVSQDLRFFVHEHPTLLPNGSFRHEIAFPFAGMYRLLGDFYPDGATPQLIAKTVIVPGPAQAAVTLGRDYSGKDAQNLRVELSTDPPEPVAHMPAVLYFRLTPAEGLEKYLGAWGHMLAASDDLIDMIHQHPVVASGERVDFSLVFPRARTYRIWVQFQRNGVVNTVQFDVPVKELR